ncbi:---NA--- [Podarcis lilfordi]|uniref:---NA n=1 Tax=Podarcis lilfordi TaxID=74358 RepID=A0AA35LD85_9SAUR|nr:---NA--- [Podarcis lilfordi]
MEENTENIPVYEGNIFGVDMGTINELMRDDSIIDCFIVNPRDESSLMDCDDDLSDIFGEGDHGLIPFAGLFDDEGSMLDAEGAAPLESEVAMVDLPPSPADKPTVAPEAAAAAAEPTVAPEAEAAAAATKKRAGGEPSVTKGFKSTEMLPSSEPKKKVRKTNREVPDEEQPSCSYQEAPSKASPPYNVQEAVAAVEARMKTLVPLRTTPEPQLLSEMEEIQSTEDEGEEEREWNKTPQKLLRVLQQKVATTGNKTISFFELTYNMGCKEVGGTFYCLLELANMRAIDMKQEDICSDITIIPADKFYEL